MADITLVTNAGAIDLSRPCNTDLSSKQYYAVKHDTSEEVVISGANNKSLGILQNAPNGSSNEAIAVVRISGVSKAKLGEAVIFGNFLTPTSTGTLEVCDAAGEEYICKSLTSGDSADLASVLVCHGEVEASDA